MILSRNRNFFPKQCQQIDLYNGELQTIFLNII
jgi:hypothetical protein